MEIILIFSIGIFADLEGGAGASAGECAIGCSDEGRSVLGDEGS